jgi:hypothetical protein
MAGELLLSALRHVWSTLAALKIDMALMGGIAVAAWRHFRNTRDVDLLVGVRHEDEEELLQKLSAAGLKLLHDPPVVHVGGSRILQLSYEPPGRFLDIRVDLFFADSEFHRQALARRVSAVLPGMTEPVSILSCEDLILFKLLAGRILDRLDCASLLRANERTLDIGYLKESAVRLKLNDALREMWHEAYGPQSPPPV